MMTASCDSTPSLSHCTVPCYRIKPARVANTCSRLLFTTLAHPPALALSILDHHSSHPSIRRLWKDHDIASIRFCRCLSTRPSSPASTMHHHGSPVADVLPSSPPDMSSSPSNPFLSPTRTSRRKDKRQPSVTPRRFGRFFTPRSTLPREHRVTLGVLNASATNRQMLSPHSLAGDPLTSDPLCPSSPTEGLGQHRVSGDKRKQNGRDQPIVKRRRGLLPDDMDPPLLRLPGRSFHMSRNGDVRMVETQPEPDARDAHGLDDKRRTTLVGGQLACV